MIIDEIGGVHEVSDRLQLEEILARRHFGDINAFWLSAESGGHPTLLILVKGDQAVLHYMTMPEEPGLRSLGQSEARGYIDFSISGNTADDVEEPVASIVTLEAAWCAAREFFESYSLPQSINWVEV